MDNAQERLDKAIEEQDFKATLKLIADVVSEQEYQKGYEDARRETIREYRENVVEDIKARIKVWKYIWKGEAGELMEYAAETCINALDYFMD